MSETKVRRSMHPWGRRRLHKNLQRIPVAHSDVSILLRHVIYVDFYPSWKSKLVVCHDVPILHEHERDRLIRRVERLNGSGRSEHLSFFAWRNGRIDDLNRCWR